MVLPIILSVIVVVVYGAFMEQWSYYLPQLQAVTAAKSLNDDSISGNAYAQWFNSGDHVGTLATVLMLLVLALIWGVYLSKKVRGGSISACFLLMLLLAGCEAGSARATTDSEKNASSDIVEVKPNQTAFEIPATGANLSGQVQFSSIKYLEEKKAANKRIVIKKDNIGQRYIPQEYVILVDHTPVTRQWTVDNTTGTNQKNEGLCGETKESIEVCFQVALGAVVKEQDAATYLYNYPTFRLEDPHVAGVYTATPLDTVVDNQVRQYMQEQLGAELATRDMDTVIHEDKIGMLKTAAKATIDYFAQQGITIGYAGMGGELVFDPTIQKAINELYIAQQRVKIAKSLATVTAIDADAKKAAAEKMGEGDSAALGKLCDAMKGNCSNLGTALEGYRWDGSRVIMNSSGDNKPVVALPLPTSTPVPPAPTPNPSAKPTPAKS